MNPLHKAMQSHGVSFQPRKDNAALWAKASSNLPFQSVSHAAEMIDYQHEYLTCDGTDVQDASVILFSCGKPVGLWVLTISAKDGQLALTSCGQPVFSPTFRGDISPKAEKRLCSRLIDCLLDFDRAHTSPAILRLQQEHLLGRASLSISEWHRQIILAGASAKPKYILYTDVSQSVAEIRASFRKSFKPLINRAYREWDFFVMDAANVSPDIWREFQDLHLHVSGRKTRSQKSWDMQLAIISAGYGFLVGLRAKDDGRLVGGGFFQNTRDEALYAVGVYDRTLFDKPLGHGVQWRAIEHMRACGIRLYKIGERHFPQDVPEPTEKEISISIFKEGFASDIRIAFQFQLAGPAS